MGHDLQNYQPFLTPHSSSSVVETHKHGTETSARPSTANLQATPKTLDNPSTEKSLTLSSSTQALTHTTTLHDSIHMLTPQSLPRQRRHDSTLHTCTTSRQRCGPFSCPHEKFCMACTVRKSLHGWPVGYLADGHPVLTFINFFNQELSLRCPLLGVGTWR